MSRILVVDDEPHIAHLLTVNLQRQGYEVQTASDGLQALEQLRTGHFDLVVSDVMMPEMDGIELLAHIRRDASLRALPLILLMSLRNEAAPEDDLPGFDLRRQIQAIATRAGANDSVIKPFSPAELMHKVGKLLSAQR